MSNDMILYQSVITDIRNIIAAGRESAYSAASTATLYCTIMSGCLCRNT